MIRRAVAPLCWLLLAACAPMPPVSATARAPGIGQEPAAAAAAVPAMPPAAPPAATPADLAAREMLAFQDHLRQLSPQDVARELARLGDEPPSPRTTLQLALLLGTRGNGDIARALSLLEPLLRSTAPDAAPWQPLARLIAAHYAEQRRLEEQIERQNQQARESQRRIDQLNDKLEALKAIEHSLTARPAAAAPAASASGVRGTQP